MQVTTRNVAHATNMHGSVYFHTRLFYGQCARVAAGQPGEIEDWAIDIMALLPSGRFSIYPNRGGRRPRARLEGKRWLSLGY